MKHWIDKSAFQRDLRKLGTALLIAGMVSVIFGSFEGQEVPPEIYVTALIIGLVLWASGLIRKTEVNT